MPTPDLAAGDKSLTAVESIPDHTFALYVFEYSKNEFVRQNLPNNEIPKAYLDEASDSGDDAFVMAEKKIRKSFSQGKISCFLLLMSLFWCKKKSK